MINKKETLADTAGDSFVLKQRILCRSVQIYEKLVFIIIRVNVIILSYRYK